MTCWSYDYKGVFKGWSYIRVDRSLYVKLLELRAHLSNGLLVFVTDSSGRLRGRAMTANTQPRYQHVY